MRQKIKSVRRNFVTKRVQIRQIDLLFCQIQFYGCQNELKFRYLTLTYAVLTWKRYRI